MITITKKDKCCGCHACENICPKLCIQMIEDKEGFLYPEVDKDKCIKCGLCEKVCPIIVEKKVNTEIVSYACINKDERTRADSSSGGVFFLLCEEVIKNKGVVFGAAFDDNFKVRHSYAESLEECSKFRGSKYVQSRINDNYKKARDFLEEGRTVLFTGTQCQIEGLNLFLRKKYNNLITVDVICHGVPSPRIFELHKQSLIEEYKSNINNIKFRDKSKGWSNFSVVIDFKNGKRYSKTLNEDIFMKGFLSNLYLRPSCYKCKSKNFVNGSDISLADYWGVAKIHPEIYDNKGTSLILVNSEKGREIFNYIRDKIKVIETDINFAIENNPCIIKSTDINTKRNKLFKYIEKESLSNSVNKCIKVKFSDKVRNKLRYEFSKLLVTNNTC